MNPKTSDRYVRLVGHAAAALLLAAALIGGLSATRTARWPAGPDSLRDIGAAETVRLSLARSLRRHTFLPDPNYRGEVFWYSPLMPAAIGAIANATGAPVNVVATRGAVLWNLAAPVAFYLLAAAWCGPLASLCALAFFLFVEPFRSWQAATYSPALNASSLAQPFLYLGLLLWTRRQPPRSAVDGYTIGTGVLLGLAFLTHPAPAAILALFVAVDTLFQAVRRQGDERRRGLGAFALVAVTSLIVASPGLSVLVHYQGHIRNALPFMWMDPAMGPEHVGAFLWQNATAYGFAIPSAIGLVALASRPGPRRRWILTWGVLAVVLFAWAGYLWRMMPTDRAATWTIAPAHHFLIYVRAVQAILGGLGVVAVGGAIAATVKRGRRTAAVSALALTTALVLVSLPSYPERDSDLVAPEFSEAQIAVIDWIRSNTAPSHVFLAPENAGLSMIGVAARRTVVVDQFFSNPYVDWAERSRESSAMWTALARGDCREWQSHAEPFAVTHLLLVDGMTPPVADGTCGFEKRIEAFPFAVYTNLSSASAAVAR